MSFTTDLIDSASKISYADIANLIFAIIVGVIGYIFAKKDNRKNLQIQLKLKIYERLAEEIWALHRVIFKLNAQIILPPLILMKGTGTPQKDLFKYRSGVWLKYTKELSEQFAMFSKRNTGVWRMFEDWQVLFPKLRLSSKILFNDEGRKFSDTHREFMRRLQQLQITNFEHWDHEEIKEWAKEYSAFTSDYGSFIEDFVALLSNVSTRSISWHKRHSRNFKDGDLEDPLEYKALTLKGIITKRWWGKRKIRNIFKYHVLRKNLFEKK